MPQPKQLLAWTIYCRVLKKTFFYTKKDLSKFSISHWYIFLAHLLVFATKFVAHVFVSNCQYVISVLVTEIINMKTQTDIDEQTIHLFWTLA